MKYFFITQDIKLTDAPQIVNWYQKLNVEEIGMGTYHKIPNRIVLQLKENKDVYFPEIVFHPCFMVSKKLKKIMQLYEPTLLYKEIILLDTQNEKTSLYYIPYLEEIDCLVKEKTKFGNFKATIEKGAIQKEKAGDTCIFYIEYNNSEYYVERHDLLESMIRREAILKISELDII